VKKVLNSKTGEDETSKKVKKRGGLNANVLKRARPTCPAYDQEEEGTRFGGKNALQRVKKKM